MKRKIEYQICTKARKIFQERLHTCHSNGMKIPENMSQDAETLPDSPDNGDLCVVAEVDRWT